MRLGDKAVGWGNHRKQTRSEGVYSKEKTEQYERCLVRRKVESKPEEIELAARSTKRCPQC